MFDKDRTYTAPWQSGITGIGYNRKVVGELNSMEALFDPKYKGKVTFLSDARDATSLVMLMNGVKPEEAKLDDVMAAIDKIDEAQQAGQIRRFTGNDYTTDLTKGNVVIAMAYAADLIQLKQDNPDLDFSVPEEGAVRWSDNMMIPAKAEHPYGAEVWMNYVYEPEVAAKICAYVGSISPVDGIQELVAKTAPDLAENPLVFPDAETQARLSGYPDLLPAGRAADERALRPGHRGLTSSAISSAMASEAVAAGDGALSTCTARPVRTSRKSSTSPPSRPTACARTPAGPRWTSPGRIAGT